MSQTITKKLTCDNEGCDNAIDVTIKGSMNTNLFDEFIKWDAPDHNPELVFCPSCLNNQNWETAASNFYLHTFPRASEDEVADLLCREGYTIARKSVLAYLSDIPEHVVKKYRSK